MGISVKNLISALSNNVKYILNYPDAQISTIQPLDSADELSDPDCLYVSNTLKPDDVISELKGKRSSVLLIADELDYYVPSNINLFVAPTKELFDSVINTVKSDLSWQLYLAQVSDEMLAVCRKNSQLNDLVAYGYTVLNNPMIVADMTCNIFSHAGVEGMDNEPLWTEAVEKNQFPSDYIALVMEHEKGTQPQFPMPEGFKYDPPGTLSNHAMFSAAITYKGNTIGYIKMLEYKRKVTEQDMELLSLLSSYASLILPLTFNRIYDKDSEANVFIKNVLEGHYSDETEIYRLQKLYGLRFFNNITLINIHYDLFRDPLPSTFFPTRQFNSIFGNSRAFRFKDGLILIVDSNSLDEIRDIPHNKKFIHMLETSKCYADISSPFTDFTSLVRYFNQTRFLQEYRLIMNDHSLTLSYPDIYEYHMIMSMYNQGKMEDFLDPIVKTLIDYEGYDGELLKTLFSYVENHCSISDTAKNIYMHYNTLKNRIAKIKDITGFSEEDHRACFNIALSERIIRMFSAIDQFSPS